MAIDIDLGDGKFATVKEVHELRSGDRTAANAAFELRVDPETRKSFIPGDMDDRMRRALLRRIIVAWNLEWPLPIKKPDSLDKLTLEQEDRLNEGIEEHLKAVKGGKDDDEPDPTDSAS